MSVPKFEVAKEVYNMGHYEAAIKYAKEAQKLDKKNWQILNFIGTAFGKLGEYDECIKYYKKAVRISKKNVTLISNLGTAFREKGEHELAKQHFEEAVLLEPDNHDVRSNLALVGFLLGDMPIFKANSPSRKFAIGASVASPDIAPDYTGNENIAGTHILICREQGIGDEIFFLRLLPEFMKRKSVRITALCDPRLGGIFSRSIKDVTFRSDVRDIVAQGSIDFEMPMGDLLTYSKDLNVGKGSSKLLPEQSKEAVWKKRIELLKEKGAIVGISWKGGGDIRSRKKRSIQLRDIIQNLPEDVQLVNLQYDYTSEELLEAERETGRKIWNWDFFDPRYDIENLAGLISNLDAVVSVDNVTVHLSGAMNVPTIVFLPLDPDYRWGLQNNSSNFYPTVKYIRQKEYGNWDVLSNAGEVLASILRDPGFQI